MAVVKKMKIKVQEKRIKRGEGKRRNWHQKRGKFRLFGLWMLKISLSHLNKLTWPSLENLKKCFITYAVAVFESRQFEREKITGPGSQLWLQLRSEWICLAQSADVFDKKLIYDALKKFGYDDFRPGQEEGILRILRGTHHDTILPEMLVLFNLGFIMWLLKDEKSCTILSCLYFLLKNWRGWVISLD